MSTNRQAGKFAGILDPFRGLGQWLGKNEREGQSSQAQAHSVVPPSANVTTPQSATPQITVNPQPATSIPQELPAATASSSQPSLPTKTDPFAPPTSTDESAVCTNMKLERLYPDHGPIQGGEEILIVGSGFDERQRLTIKFGHNTTVQTVFKALNLLLCDLPPSQTAGPTCVTLHSEGGNARVSADICTFTYIDQRVKEVYVTPLQLCNELIVF